MYSIDDLNQNLKIHILIVFILYRMYTMYSSIISIPQMCTEHRQDYIFT